MRKVEINELRRIEAGGETIKATGLITSLFTIAGDIFGSLFKKDNTLIKALPIVLIPVMASITLPLLKKLFDKKEDATT